MESWKLLREKSNGERAKIKSNGRWVDVSDKVLTRAELSRLVSRLSFAKVFRAHSAERVRKWNEKLRRTDPSRHAAMKAAKRAERAGRRLTTARGQNAC